ncbi:hypothetical protein [Clostridium sp. Marseille-Q7071]
MIYQIQRIVGRRCEVIGINKYCGEIFEPEEIINSIREVDV